MFVRALASILVLGCSGCHCGSRMAPPPADPDTGPTVTDAGPACSTEICDGFDDDCDGVADEGFDLDGDPDNCGACGVVCPSYFGSQRHCLGGACAAICEPFLADCDGDIETGCEVDIGFDPRHCGGCGRRCADGFECRAGTCGETPVAVSAGGDFTCLLLESGTVWCWGSNNDGRLGDGTTIDRPVPTEVGGDAAVTGVRFLMSGDWHSCIIVDDGSVKCWGTGSAHQLGTGDHAPEYEPTATRPFPAAIEADGGHAGTVARTQTGDVYYWGAKRYPDHVYWDFRPTPVPLPGRAIDVGAGSQHSCVVLEDGDVHCWGWNEHRQLGDGSEAPAVAPVRAAIDGAVQVTGGGEHTCALHTDGTVSCWGRNEAGQAGGTGLVVGTPRRVTGVDRVAEVAGGAHHTCARHRGGTVSCWGDNEHGQLGADRSSRTPAPVPLVTDATTLAAGRFHNCAITLGAEVLCWGADFAGQLGDGLTDDRPRADKVACLPGYECPGS